MKRLLLLLTAFMSLTITTYADHTFTRRYTDSHCNTHIQCVRVDDDGNEEIYNDYIIGTNTPCDGDKK
jgi:hypothetical protein